MMTLVVMMMIMLILVLTMLPVSHRVTKSIN